MIFSDFDEKRDGGKPHPKNHFQIIREADTTLFHSSLLLFTFKNRLHFRFCLKIVNTPKRRLFFRHTALVFLEIQQVFPRKIALSGEKNFLTLGHIANYQTRPK